MQVLLASETVGGDQGENLRWVVGGPSVDLRKY
jgi:hypothetical protein